MACVNEFRCILSPFRNNWVRLGYFVDEHASTMNSALARIKHLSAGTGSYGGTPRPVAFGQSLKLIAMLGPALQ